MQQSDSHVYTRFAKLNLYTNFQLQIDPDSLAVLFGEHQIYPRNGTFTSGNGEENGQSLDVK